VGYIDNTDNNNYGLDEIVEFDSDETFSCDDDESQPEEH